MVLNCKQTTYLFIISQMRIRCLFELLSISYEGDTFQTESSRAINKHNMVLWSVSLIRRFLHRWKAREWRTFSCKNACRDIKATVMHWGKQQVYQITQDQIMNQQKKGSISRVIRHTADGFIVSKLNKKGRGKNATILHCILSWIINNLLFINNMTKHQIVLMITCGHLVYIH